jgi:hypothetical protein
MGKEPSLPRPKIHLYARKGTVLLRINIAAIAGAASGSPTSTVTETLAAPSMPPEFWIKAVMSSVQALDLRGCITTLILSSAFQFRGQFSSEVVAGRPFSDGSPSG